MAFNEYAYLLDSEARTADTFSMDYSNKSGRGLHCVLSITNVVPSGSITLTIEGKDRLSGDYYTLLQSAAYTSTGTKVHRVYPGLTVSTNLTANDVLPETWRVKVAHATPDAVTYSVGASIIE